MGVAQIFFGNNFQEAFLHLVGRFPRGQPGAVSQAEEMGINGDGRRSKDDVQNHIGGFAAYAGKGLEGFTFAWNPAAVFLNQDF